MLPVGLAYGTTENEQLARALDLPLFAKFRSAYERLPNEGAPPAREAARSARDPLPGDGLPGDSWINTATNKLFGPKSLAGTWPAGVSLIGPQGRVIGIHTASGW